MNVRVLEEAEVELLEAVNFYEDCRTGLGVDFNDRVTEAMLAIGRDPLRFQLYEVPVAIVYDSIRFDEGFRAVLSWKTSWCWN